MQDQNPKKYEPSIADKLTYIVNQMLEPFGKSLQRGRGLGTAFLPPFDISKPNQHNSKGEFQRELDVITNSLEGLDKAISALVGPQEESGKKRVDPCLMQALDAKFKSDSTAGDLNSSLNLIRKNVADVGGYAGSLLVMLDLRKALELQLDELKDQEDKFWNVSHRPPDYHARAIALRLAKLFARETGKRPTYGTSGETGDPSTSFTRALRASYQVLGISADVRAPATWAISKIRESDLQPSHQSEIEGLISGLLGPASEAEIDPDLEKYLGETPSRQATSLPPLPKKKPRS